MAKKKLSLENLDVLDNTEFEEFCFELLGELGFVNIDWRKGTALRGSPADRGRDIVAQHERQDIDGTKHLEDWFIDCKHYKKGVPAEKLQNLLAWSTAERPHVACFIVSGFLANGAKDFLRDYELNNRPPFRVKYWERPTLERMLLGHEDLVRRFLFDVARNDSEILLAEEELFDRVWYNRHLNWVYRVENGQTPKPTPELWRTSHEAAQRVRERWGEDNLGPYDDFEWGMINGKLSALRWALGSEWDFLDT
ncbi:restriction endonuclease [Actinomadura sp. 3N508]|uniref:restriction endonuclease n=1 Tax=Actinomadura sp. 3N508 TaxID=3375153 RepID=UPI0037B1140D